MAIATIAFRNLSRQKRRSFLLAGAIAFGILVITAVNGLVGGILKNTENNFSVMLAAHVMVMDVHFTDKNRMVMQIDDEKPMTTAIEKLSQDFPVRYYQARTSIFNGATLMNQNESVWLQVDGVDWKNDRFLAENLTLKAGTLDDMAASDGIVLGEKTAKKLNIEVGETLLVQCETIHGQQNVLEAPVKAIFQEDNLSAGTVYMDKEQVNRLLDMPEGSANWYGIFLDKFDDQDAATRELGKILSDAGKTVYPREKSIGKSFNTLFGDLRKEKDKAKKQAGQTLVADLNDSLAAMTGIFGTIRVVSLAVLVLLLTVIMVGLNNTYRIIVWERSREIGTMRAIGMQRNHVARLFLFEAVFLALVGVASGMIGSTILLTIISWIPFSGSGDFAIFLSKGHLSWNYDIGQLLVSTLLVVVLSLLAAWSPSRKAGKVDPAVALRSTT